MRTAGLVALGCVAVTGGALSWSGLVGWSHRPPQESAAEWHTAPDHPTTRPAAPDSTPSDGPRRVALDVAPMPPSYAVLFSRSIFAKGGGAARGPAGAGGPQGTEAALVLRGVTLREGRFTAFVEDLAARQVNGLREGDAVGRGRVGRISFDGVEYDAAGGQTWVGIGSSLDGGATMPAAAAAPVSPPAGERERHSVAPSGSPDGAAGEARPDKRRGRGGEERLAGAAD